MEIKQGDKVRVSKDAPEMYFFGCNHDDSDYKVILVDRDNAVITQMKNGSFAIPTKYLVKVDAEANVKIGDKVVVHYPNGDRIGRIQEEMLDGTYDIDYGDGCTGHNITRSQIEPYTAPKYKVGNWVMISGVFNPQLNGMIGWISRIDKDGNKVSSQDGRFAIVEDKYLTLITQPTEQAEAEEEPCVGHINFAERIKRQQEAHQAIVDEFRSRSFDWDVYTADLAKELAIAYGKRGKSPLDAVAAAKEIVKRLKQK